MSVPRSARRACAATAASAARSPAPRERPRLVVVPVEPRDLRAARRRRDRPDARLRELDGRERVGHQDRAGERGRQGARRRREEGGHRDLRVRPRRLPLPRTREGARRGRPRRRTPSFEHVPDVRDPRAEGAGDRDQPRRQGRQGRPAVLVHGARRHRRRGRSRRPRVREGARGAARDLEGGRGREEEPLPRPEARADDHARDHRPVRRRAGRPASRERGNGRHRRRRRARGARARRHPRRPREEPRDDDADQHDARDGRRACSGSCARRTSPPARGKTIAEVLPVARGGSASADEQLRTPRRRAGVGGGAAEETMPSEPAEDHAGTERDRPVRPPSRHPARARPREDRPERPSMQDSPQLRGMLRQVTHLVPVDGEEA